MQWIGTLTVVGGLALVFGLLLALASKKFAVVGDARMAKIREVLPGANCGGCGYSGCDGYAAALRAGDARADLCPVGGAELSVVLGRLMGIAAGSTKDMVAMVRCQGSHDKCENKFEYLGIEDCRAAALLGDGIKRCKYGCMGLGSCVASCPFGAMRINEGGIAEVDEAECKGCGRCVIACPKNLIALFPRDQKVRVACSAPERGRSVRGNCLIGCIGCQLCVKACPEGAVEFEDNLARIDAEKCIACGLCAEKCPSGSIRIFEITQKHIGKNAAI